jgi:hypothetical protein
MRCGYGDQFAALYDSGVLITLSNGVPVVSPTDKEHIVHRFPNDFSIADLAWAATVLRYRLSLK